MSDSPACVQAPRQPYHSYRYPFQGFYLIKAKTTVCFKPEKQVILFDLYYKKQDRNGFIVVKVKSAIQMVMYVFNNL